MTFRLVMRPEVTRALLERATQLPDDILEKAPVFFGTQDDVIDGNEKYVRAGTRHFVVNFYVRPEVLKDNLKLFAEKVIPYFRQK